MKLFLDTINVAYRFQGSEAENTSSFLAKPSDISIPKTLGLPSQYHNFRQIQDNSANIAF
jgi:hypothetical protein